jgi:superfamily II DNA or RNA helicase
VSHWPRITVGGKYGTSIVVTGNLKALPRHAQSVIRKHFNRWRALNDPIRFPDLLSELKGMSPAISVDPAAVERYNTYLEVHTVVFFGISTAGNTKMAARKKSTRTTPRIAAVISAFTGEGGVLLRPDRIWEFSERLKEADALIEFDKSFGAPFAAMASGTVAFLPSKFFKYQVEVGFHPKTLKKLFADLLAQYLEKWDYIERNGLPAARWLLANPGQLPEAARVLASKGCAVHIQRGAWDCALRAILVSGGRAPSPPVELFDPVMHSSAHSPSMLTTPVSDAELNEAVSAMLYPYQRTGVRHLVHTGRAMLADDMGLGKSLQALAALRVLAKKEGLSRALIICPASIKHQWKMEIERFTPLSPVVIEGNRERRDEIYAMADARRRRGQGAPVGRYPEIFIVNYELSFRDHRGLLSLAPDAIILDEAQRIKNWQSKTHKAVVSMPAKYRFVLTGTPLENELMELFDVLLFVDPEVLGQNPIAVRERYIVPDKFGGIQGYRNLREASRRISGVSLRRTREETLPELPELVESYWWLEMDDVQAKIYRDVEERAAAFLSVEEWDRVAYDSMLTTVQRLREVCDTPEMLFPEHRESAKLRELSVLVSEQVKGMGRRAIIFTQWTRMADILARELEKWGVTFRYLHGGVGPRDRAKIIQEFARGEAQIFLSTDAGSAGLNLQAATIVVNFDLPFNPAIVDQRVARAHRIGQKSSVNAWHFVCRNTIEENLVKILKKRRELFEDVFSEVGDGTAGSGARRSREFLMELLGRRVPPLQAAGG